MNQPTQVPSRRRRGPSDRQPVQEWASLEPGDFVEVSPGGTFLYAAYVDDRSDDGELIWVVEDGTGCRRLFVRDDPVLLYAIQDSAHRNF